MRSQMALAAYGELALLTSMTRSSVAGLKVRQLAHSGQSLLAHCHSCNAQHNAVWLGEVFNGGAFFNLGC
jgi:hypothetical protein